MNAAKHWSAPLIDDYLARARILKLRWMGLEDEADLLAARQVARSTGDSMLPRDPRQTD